MPAMFGSGGSDEIFSDPRKELALSALLLTNRRIIEKKQKQMEHERQKQIKNASRQQLEIKLHQHQFPHPTQQQIQAEQQHLQVLYGQNSVSLYNPHFLTSGANSAAGSGGGGGGGGGGGPGDGVTTEPIARQEFSSGYIQGTLFLAFFFLLFFSLCSQD